MLLRLPQKALDLAFMANASDWSVAITTDVIEDNRYVYLVCAKNGARIHVTWCNGVFRSSYLSRAEGMKQVALRNASDARRLIEGRDNAYQLKSVRSVLPVSDEV